MQLTARSVAAVLVASAVLVTAARSEAEGTVDTRASSEVAAYGDTDHVFVFTPSIAGSVSSPTAGWSVDGRYLVDVVSAASVDIVSTASRRWEETRHAGTLNAAYKPHDFGVAATSSFSTEPDYLAWTAGGSITQDLLDKNVTLSAGFVYGHDVAGRHDTPFSTYSLPLDRGAFDAGVTFVANRSTLISLLGDVILERGDPSKPYRYIPLFAPGTYVPIGASIDVVNGLRLAERPLEQLPKSRDRFAVTGRVAHRFERSTLRLDERLYTDSWSLHASSTDARLLVDLSSRVMLGPHVRFHAQTPVSFWQRAYVLAPGWDYPAYRTGDRELGPMLAFTGGGQLRVGVGSRAQPKSCALGVDLAVTETRYLDDLYIEGRLSTLLAVSLEGEL